ICISACTMCSPVHAQQASQTSLYTAGNNHPRSLKKSRQCSGKRYKLKPSPNFGESRSLHNSQDSPGIPVLLTFLRQMVPSTKILCCKNKGKRLKNKHQRVSFFDGSAFGAGDLRKFCLTFYKMRPGHAAAQIPLQRPAPALGKYTLLLIGKNPFCKR